ALHPGRGGDRGGGQFAHGLVELGLGGVGAAEAAGPVRRALGGDGGLELLHEVVHRRGRLAVADEGVDRLEVVGDQLTGADGGAGVDARGRGDGGRDLALDRAGDGVGRIGRAGQVGDLAHVEQQGLQRRRRAGGGAEGGWVG